LSIIPLTSNDGEAFKYPHNNKNVVTPSLDDLMMKLVKPLGYLILALELVAVTLYAYLIYLFLSFRPIDMPSYLGLLAGAGFFTVLGASLWNKWYKSIKKEKPELLSPGVETTVHLISASKALIGSVRDTKTALGWMIANVFVYSIFIVEFKPITQDYFFVASGFCFHLLYLAFILFLVLKRGETRRTLGLVRGDTRAGIPFVIVITVTLLSAVLLKKFFLKLPLFPVFNQDVWYLVTVFTFFVLCAPVTEEVFHRGYLQNRFIARLGGSWGIILSSIVWTFIHIPKVVLAPELVASKYINVPILTGFDSTFLLINPRAILMEVLFGPFSPYIYIFAIGLLLGFVARELNSIYYPIILHASWNFIFTLFGGF